MTEPTKVVKTAGGEFRAATEIFVIIILVAIASQLLAPWFAEHFPYIQISFLNIENKDWWVVNIIAMLSAPIVYCRAHTRWQKSKLVWELANTDHLTGLYNRRYLLEAMERELELADRFDDYSVGLLMIDIDNFKKVNDTYGHSIGDEVIKFVAETLQTKTRTYCISSRYGGEEFVQIIPKSDIEQTRNAANNLLKTINKESRLYDGHSISVSVSIGVAVIPNCAASINEWLDQADHAMYISKATGKNKVTIFGDPE